MTSRGKLNRRLLEAATKKPALSLVKKGAPPRKPPSRSVRPRNYLLVDEVKAMREAAAANAATNQAAIARGKFGGAGPAYPYLVRDELLILLLFRHALRVGEAVALRWDQVDWKNSRLVLQYREKNGVPGVHPIEPDELKMLMDLRKWKEKDTYIFFSSRSPHLSERQAHKIVADAGRTAQIPFPVHPHMLRHAKGYQLVNAGYDLRRIQGYMGHSSMESTTVYTHLAADAYIGMGGDDIGRETNG